MHKWTNKLPRRRNVGLSGSVSAAQNLTQNVLQVGFWAAEKERSVDRTVVGLSQSTLGRHMYPHTPALSHPPGGKSPNILIFFGSRYSNLQNKLALITLTLIKVSLTLHLAIVRMAQPQSRDQYEINCRRVSMYIIVANPFRSLQSYYHPCPEPPPPPSTPSPGVDIRISGGCTEYGGGGVSQPPPPSSWLGGSEPPPPPHLPKGVWTDFPLVLRSTFF